MAQDRSIVPGTRTTSYFTNPDPNSMMKVNFVISLLAFRLVLATVLGVPTNETSLAGRSGGSWQFYYGVTSAQHQIEFDKLYKDNRMISLSVYGQPPNHRYAAVWVQRPGPLYFAIHEASRLAYIIFFNTHARNGYVSTIITVTGPSSGPIFAGVMEKNGVTNWYQKYDMTQSQYLAELKSAEDEHFILKSFAEYGSPSARLYCGVWYYNDQWDKYTTFVSQDYSAYQVRFNAETTKPFWRPSYLSVSEDHQISSTFVDTDVGSWVARHGMTASSLQSEYVTQKAAGRYIIHLQGGGTGSNTNFAALWATQDIPTPRTWRVTASGSVTGFQNNNAVSSQADALMQTFMKTNGVRQAQFSVAKNGNLLLQKGYSWSEATRHTTTTSDVFLLASVSKAFVAAAIQTLYNSNMLSSSTKVYPFLGYTNTFDPRLQQITVDHLLNHWGGLNVTESNFDPTYNMLEIADKRNTGPNPATIKDVVDHMSNYTLDYDPGYPREAYSNYGYLLLSYVVEHVTGMAYYDYLSSAVLTPGGYDVRKWPTSPSAHVNDPITHESKDTGPNAATPQTKILIAHIFGGDGMYKDDCYGPAALAASATTLVAFIHSNAAWGIGPRAPKSARLGSTPGTSTYAASRPDDQVDWSVTVNTRDFPPSSSPQDPFVTFCTITVPGFLDAHPTT